ncbi:MAG: EAL domain-containing protein [Betaproteobacteria bacterium]|nr:EAL domain-containing protein [Betaproteobacteria bacterium]
MALLERTDREDTIPQLLRAINQENFILYGQLIVPISAPRESRGYIEVLVRYLEEEKNLLPPGGFFEVLESLNLMSMLDRWVLNRVVGSMVEQHEVHKEWSIPRYSVNLSVDSLYENEFLSLIHEYFRRFELPPGKLGLEIDESDAHTRLDELAKLTSSVNPLGCGFTITSYTGELIHPNLLRSLNVESVKMDGKAIAVISSDEAARVDASATYRACKNQGVRVIAEMVEQREVLKQLKALGVDYAQGYAICRPAPLHGLHRASK